MPLYSSLSEGRSEAISRWLLLSEQMALPLCRIPDRWARRFNAAGIPIVKEEFLSMEKVPDFKEKLPFSPSSLAHFSPRSGNKIATALLRAYRTGGFEGASSAANRELNGLGSDLTFHPMLRHMLESVIRVANLAPLHENRRLELSLKESTLGLSKWLFFSHFSAFQFATWLDAKAAPLHAEGLPIVFQDVPAIPPVSDFYAALSSR
ncbi:MAG: hypothetical protein KGP28_04775 [Bdellovibrionales bacterium]|nr:hypothetical protein [Bdellovibrionales bacterium]